MSLSEMYDDLEDHIVDAPAADTDASGQFVIDTLEKADWAVRKIGRARRQLAQASELAQAERARIDAWETDAIGRCENDTEFLEDLLHRYHRSLLDADPKAKTIRLPSGELVARKQPDVLVYDGGEDTVEWAEANAPDVVVVKKSVDRTAAKSYFTVTDVEKPEGFVVVHPETMETVPGCWARIGDIKFSVKTADQ